MTITEYIQRLEDIRAEHGELEVETSDFYGRRCSAFQPDVAFRRILSKRESKPQFWYD